MKSVARVLVALSFGVLAVPGSLLADEVLDWNRVMLQAGLAAVPPTSPVVMSRVAAIVHASVFDAVNGIERRHTPVRVMPDAPRGRVPSGSGRAGGLREPRPDLPGPGGHVRRRAGEVPRRPSREASRSASGGQRPRR